MQCLTGYKVKICKNLDIFSTRNFDCTRVKDAFSNKIEHGVNHNVQI